MANKLRDTICNIINAEPGVSRTQLVKLAYLTDRKHYENHNESLTGANYVLYFYGPYSHEFKSVLSDLKSEDIIEEEYDGFSYKISLTTKGLENIPILTNEENDSLMTIISLAEDKKLLRSTSAIKKYVYDLKEVKETEPFQPIDLNKIG